MFERHLQNIPEISCDYPLAIYHFAFPFQPDNHPLLFLKHTLLPNIKYMLDHSVAKQLKHIQSSERLCAIASKTQQ